MLMHIIGNLFLISYDQVFLNERYFCWIRTFISKIWFDSSPKQFIICYVLKFNLAKYCFLSFLRDLDKNFLDVCNFALKVLFLLIFEFWRKYHCFSQQFLSFDGSIIAFLNNSVVKKLLLCLKIFFLSGACLFNFCMPE